jgi:phage baseplate assembly protein W
MATINEVMLTDIAHNEDYVLSVQGGWDRISGLANLKQALFHRLITSPGSLAHRPNYGVGIKDFQNSPSGLEAQRRLANRIKEQFEQDPRVESVTGVRVDVDDLTPELTSIVVRVKPIGYDESQVTFIPFGEVAG